MSPVENALSPTLSSTTGSPSRHQTRLHRQPEASPRPVEVKPSVMGTEENGIRAAHNGAGPNESSAFGHTAESLLLSRECGPVDIYWPVQLLGERMGPGPGVGESDDERSERLPTTEEVQLEQENWRPKGGGELPSHVGRPFNDLFGKDALCDNCGVGLFSLDRIAFCRRCQV